MNSSSFSNPMKKLGIVFSSFSCRFCFRHPRGAGMTVSEQRGLPVVETARDEIVDEVPGVAPGGHPAAVGGRVGVADLDVREATDAIERQDEIVLLRAVVTDEQQHVGVVGAQGGLIAATTERRGFYFDAQAVDDQVVMCVRLAAH